MADKEFSVGQVAKRCGVNVSALHFYEQKGLIRSLRNQGNQRRFKPDVLRRVSIIKAAQAMGISLEEIKSAFDALPNSRTPNKNDWEKLSATWQAKLTEKIQYMERLRDQISGCIGCGCLSMEACPLYNPDDELAEQGPGPVLLDPR
ncbi:redox-sensitive transcriptional activator SoxR [Neiella marina]|uniref:Redox-sensitive transcriptional activator SoxR n=1 Tax=Neiella holothuriorum TaxID=2870530 RepID=A0ABS7EKE1_9GAMM|nr:redox-sensitive transcriptional activator SoxR [Neiella holothuriorum]MBW8192816.1 redox-sensitive transcriptional activator SoxR [Neiella holothuriorum]